MPRILTTHAGSLPRPDDLRQAMWDKLDGKPVDEDALAARVREAVREAVARQRAIGIDLVSDGELSKVGFSNYIYERFSGFAGVAELAADDLADYPELAQRVFANPSGAHIVLRTCVGPIELIDPDAVRRDIATLTAALDGGAPSGAFLCAPTPGQIAFNNPNRHYPSHEAYLAAAAEAMRHEYRAITDAGFALQLDSPDLAMAAHCTYVGTSIEDWESHAFAAVEALNHALEGIPPEQVRLHVCWGNYPGPHHHDKPLREVIAQRCAPTSEPCRSRRPTHATNTSGRCSRRCSCRTRCESSRASST